MEIVLTRKWKKADYTIGELSVGGRVLCNTLEDTDRGLNCMMSVVDIKRAKIYGRTAIPTGRYEILWNVSNTFRTKSWAIPYSGNVPLVDGVKGFDRIRIHPGNTAADTLGCILVGRNTVKGKVTQSVECYRNLLDNYLVPAFRRRERCYITIK